MNRRGEKNFGSIFVFFPFASNMFFTGEGMKKKDWSRYGSLCAVETAVVLGHGKGAVRRHNREKGDKRDGKEREDG
ncbi:hypothetical protein SESBI_39395 [Sesbania bispinosa]|nr:hypothetical protein SESBI_39395 [Sesbania bispinosa]